MQAVSADKTAQAKSAAVAPTVCHRCRAEVPAGSRFCNMCGSSLPRKTMPAAPDRFLQNEAPRRAIKEPRPIPSGQVPPRGVEAQPSYAVNPRDGVDRILKIIQGRQNIPAFSQHIVGVMGMMGKDEASIRHMTNMIIRDYSLTLAVLRTANSAYYNRSGKPICSVARAVTMIGVEAIKSLAGGLMLLENFENHSAGLKQLILLSMLTANHARQVATHLQLPRAEEIYLCGMFRNLGEILVACYLGEMHEKILREINENRLAEREACLKVLQFPYEHLGQAVAESWMLPGSVKQAMEPVDPFTYGKQNEEEKLGTLVAFSHELTSLVYRRAAEDKAQALDLLLGKYKAVHDLSQELIQQVLAEAVTETKSTFAAAGIPLDDLQLRNQLRLAMSHGGQWKDSGGALLSDALPAGAAPAAEPEAASPGPQKPGSDEDLLNQLLAEVKSAAEPGNEPKLNDVLMMALEACHRGARFDRVVFCLATPDRSMVRGRLGLGPAIDNAIEQLQIPLSGRQEPLTLALLNRKDLFIDAMHDGRYQDSLIVRKLGACCFGLFPVVVENVVVGCLYFDRLAPHFLPTQVILETLGHLRDVLAELIRHTRAHS
jgi:HD-like signal output (HDOD) protein